MTSPAFGSNGAIVGGTGSGTININVAYPSSIATGNQLVIALYFTGGSGLATVNTPAGFSQINGPVLGAGLYTFWAIATGSESGTLTCSLPAGGTAAVLVGQMARFTGNDTISPIENATSTPNTGSSTTPAPSSIGPATVDDLAISIIAYPNTGTCSAITGMSGGTWVESVAETNSNSRSLQWQTAAVSSGGTISGGTATLATTGAWSVANFAIMSPAAVSSLSSPLRLNQAVKRASLH